MTIIKKILTKKCEYEEWEYCCEDFAKALKVMVDSYRGLGGVKIPGRVIMPIIDYSYGIFYCKGDREYRKISFCPFCGASTKIEEQRQ